MDNKKMKMIGITSLTVASLCSLVGTGMTYNEIKNDSWRTKQGIHNKENPVKQVESINITWKNNYPTSPDGTGYNPHITQNISFSDDTQITLTYHVLAAEPLTTWFFGDEFYPKIGECYELNKKETQLIMKRDCE